MGWSSGTGGAGGTNYIDGEVNTFADLPAAASSSSQFWLVRQATGVYLINRKPKGLYYCNGVTWESAPDIVPFFNDTNFEIYNNVDNSKKILFDGSAITTANERTITMADFDVDLADIIVNGAIGIEDRTASTISFTDGTRTFNITPTSGSFNVWEGGFKYVISASTNFVISDVEGIHVIYFDAGILTESVNPTHSQISAVIQSKPLLCILYWNATDDEAIYVGEERHGIVMSPSIHDYEHWSNGLVYRYGLGLNTMSVNGGGATADAQFGIDSGAVADEDIFFNVGAIVSTTGLPIYHMEGATPEWKRTVNAGFSVRTFDNTSADRLAWNEYTGGAWQLTEVSNADFVLCHVFATTEKDNPLIAIIGQNDYLTRGSARDGAEIEIRELILDDLLFPEIRPIATIIFQTRLTYASDVNARIVSTDDGDDFVDWRNQEISRVELTTSNHNNLSGLQGGQINEYYHLTESQYISVGSVGTPARLGALDIDGTVNTIDTDIALYQVPALNYADNGKVLVCNRNNAVVSVRVAHVSGAIGVVAASEYIFYELLLQPYETKGISIDGMIATDSILIRSDIVNVTFTLMGSLGTVDNKRLKLDDTIVVANTNTALYVASGIVENISVVACNKGSAATLRIAIVDGAVGTLTDDDYLIYEDDISANETRVYSLDLDMANTYTLAVRSSSADTNFIAYGETS